MDLKERIKVALGIETEEAQEVTLAFESKLEDGTIIVSEAEELAVGVVVNILSEDGVQTPMPEGNYSLEDGTSFSTDETGLVTEVSEAEEVDADDEEDDMGKEKDKEYMSDNAELFAEVGSVVKELLEEVRKDISRISSELDELRGENLAKDENIVDLQKENTELSSQLEELGKEPSEEPINTSKFNKTSKRRELSSAEYKKLDARERFLYNLNK
ncbi:MAG: hypothetical protein Unbinned92contig1003_6 [Prokaryotic dsDNA virus sp.]|nr:MAG: hypothetical protein Unbinned92contig1003_6 [Prokaryotic dsDNA virus sp.]|tara:strand:+ start:15351 stop:15995 length:645 start_codon:yes stop_codon:yes gene_type:complete